MKNNRNHRALPRTAALDPCMTSPASPRARPFLPILQPKPMPSRRATVRATSISAGSSAPAASSSPARAPSSRAGVTMPAASSAPMHDWPSVTTAPSSRFISAAASPCVKRSKPCSRSSRNAPANPGGSAAQSARPARPCAARSALWTASSAPGACGSKARSSAAGATLRSRLPAQNSLRSMYLARIRAFVAPISHLPARLRCESGAALAAPRKSLFQKRRSTGPRPPAGVPRSP